MAYVALEDYAISVSNEELTDILDQTANGYSITATEVREACESKAEAKINNFLASKFDLAVEYAKTGTDRNMALVGVYIDLTLCAVYRSISPDDIPEMRDESCKDAINTLGMWRDGDLDLVGVPEVESPVNKREWINPTKFISKPFADPIITEGE